MPMSRASSNIANVFHALAPTVEQGEFLLGDFLVNLFEERHSIFPSGEGTNVGDRLARFGIVVMAQNGAGFPFIGQDLDCIAQGRLCGHGREVVGRGGTLARGAEARRAVVFGGDVGCVHFVCLLVATI